MVLLMVLHPTQGLEPPANPARFRGRFVNPFFDVESTLSGKVPRGWLPGVASVATGFHRVDSLASRRNPLRPRRWSCKVLILSRNFQHGRWGGFKVDSPVKKPRASEMARSAPPYTDPAEEEPSGGVICFATGSALGIGHSKRTTPTALQRWQADGNFIPLKRPRSGCKGNSHTTFRRVTAIGVTHQAASQATRYGNGRSKLLIWLASHSRWSGSRCS